ncbi:SIMPL domain-containing protein [Sphingomonas sp. LHG3406-1]|uniref:SIMPL domain-containing protein n=1 Tax=Sphingomonas sp. LHG3406-1 TaxID=2804617 RepID=UPI002627A2F7|nr:SIMPL domain-containing protein [Sphingomonas sp. LHG3406-1]
MDSQLVSNRVALLGAVGIFALGLTTSGYALGDGLRRYKLAEPRTVTVRGVSERNVTADLATWSIGFAHSGTELADVEQSVDAQARAVRAFFIGAGFKPADITDVDVSLRREQPTGRDGEPVGPEKLTVSRSIQLRTEDVMRTRDAYARQAELLRAGVELSSSSASYSFTRLNDLKPEMIAEANRNARRSAQQFASDSGVAVGKMKTASQGYFSVGARDGEECDDCGSSGGSSPFQKVRVVTTIDYDLG